MVMINYTKLNIFSEYGEFGIGSFVKLSRGKERGKLIFVLKIMRHRIIQDSDDQEYSYR